MYYHMQMLNGLEAASIYQQGEEEKGQEVPPHCNIYFTVDDVDQIAVKAKDSGAIVIFGPMDVFGAGRMAMLQDPQGAFFALWQPKEHIGSRVKGETGTVMWNEFMTGDPAGATRFYSGLLGIGSSKMPGPVDYTLLKIGETDVAGVMAISEEMEPIPLHWAVDFGVDDVDGIAKRADSLGGTIVMSSMDIPEIGRFTGLQAHKVRCLAFSNPLDKSIRLFRNSFAE